MGLKRRVSVGFMSIVGVLILSGMVSFYELNVLSNETEDILGTNRRYRDVATNMTLALRDQNRAFLQMTAFGERDFDSLCIASTKRLDVALEEARRENVVPAIVDTLDHVAGELRTLTLEFIAAPRFEAKYEQLLVDIPVLDSLSRVFPKAQYELYQPLYDRMLVEIDRYYTDSQSTLAPGTEQLHNNAYRAVTPVLISLIVMIAIVLMLYYFMMLYCVVPVVKMNKGLADYLLFKIPFAPKCERSDEMQELYNGIETLVKQYKSPTKE